MSIWQELNSYVNSKSWATRPIKKKKKTMLIGGCCGFAQRAQQKKKKTLQSDTYI
ncbi:hypothetical protein HanRHA438_Chr08g0328971 [Helianthus annuus]|nr:hypothetical protein HanRHA438_Chr08g0328971 [Helianthus annuus]